MKSAYFHLLVAMAIFAGCSETSDDSVVVVDEISDISEESSSSEATVESSSSVAESSSEAVSSSIPEKVSSSSKQEPLSSSSRPPQEVSSSSVAEFSSSRVTEVSSSSIMESSSSSEINYALLDIDSLFSYINNNETRSIYFRFLYPVEDGKLDTGFFTGSQCSFSLSGEFECQQQGCVAYVGGTYISGSTSTRRLIDINLGDSAFTTYIPYADIPKYSEERARNFLSTFPTGGCKTLYHFEGNYQFEAEGLPEGIILHQDKAIPDFEGPDTEEYAMIFKPDKLDSIEERIPWLNENAPRSSRSSYSLDGIFNEHDYASWEFYQKDSISFSAYVNDYGCGILEQHFYKRATGGFCHGWQIPDLVYTYSYRLLNISNTYPRGPFQWTLIYKDQYGRGGSVKITSEFR